MALSRTDARMSQLGFPNFSNLIFGSGQGSEAGASTGTSGGQSLGTTTQQYLIPGAQPAFNQLTGGLSSLYGNTANNLSGQWGNLDQSVLGGMQGIYNNAMTGANNLGTDALQNLQNAYGQLWGQQQQGLEDRGLGNTTISNSVQTGDQRAYQQNLGSLLEDIYKQKLNVLGQFGSAIPQEQAALGTQGLAAQQNLAQQGLGQMGGLAGQYLGLVGQQGINTQTTSNQFQNNQAQNQAQQWQQQMANASAQGGGGYGGASVGSGGGGAGGATGGGSSGGGGTGWGPNQTVPPNWQTSPAQVQNTPIGGGAGGGGAGVGGGGGITNIYNGGGVGNPQTQPTQTAPAQTDPNAAFNNFINQPNSQGQLNGFNNQGQPNWSNPGGGSNNIITQNPPGSPVGDMQPAPHNEPIPPKPGTRPLGGGFSGYYPKPGTPMPPNTNGRTAYGNTFQPGAGVRGGPSGTRPQPTMQQPGGSSVPYPVPGSRPGAIRPQGGEVTSPYSGPGTGIANPLANAPMAPNNQGPNPMASQSWLAQHPNSASTYGQPTAWNGTAGGDFGGMTQAQFEALHPYGSGINPQTGASWLPQGGPMQGTIDPRGGFSSMYARRY